MLLHKKKLYASAEDKVTYELFKEAEVIVGYQPKRVAGQQTCSVCSDGFRLHMKEEVLQTCQTNGGSDAFFHSFQGNGEAMRFAYDSPLSKGYSAITSDILGRTKTTEITELLSWADELDVQVLQHRLVHHWPCKAALSRDITLARSIDLVIRGKLRIKQQIPALCVAIDFFCDWGENEHTIDLIKKEAYLQLIETDPRFTKERDEWALYAEEVKKLPVLKWVHL
jgi:hypothetical protein